MALIIDGYITLVMKIITGNNIITSGVVNTKIHKYFGFFRSFIAKNKVKSRPIEPKSFYINPVVRCFYEKESEIVAEWSIWA